MPASDPIACQKKLKQPNAVSMHKTAERNGPGQRYPVRLQFLRLAGATYE
jgi:hypothetical protein